MLDKTIYKVSAPETAIVREQAVQTVYEFRGTKTLSHKLHWPGDKTTYSGERLEVIVTCLVPNESNGRFYSRGPGLTL